MRLATVAYGGEQLPAVIGDGDTVRLVRDLIDPAPTTMIELIEAGPELQLDWPTVERPGRRR